MSKQNSKTFQTYFFSSISSQINKYVDLKVTPLIQYIIELGGTQKEISKRLDQDPAAISRKYKKYLDKEVKHA
jgi:hypothetical protein